MCTPQKHVEQIIKAGYSQTYIAEQTGISQPTISRILSGEHTDPKSSTASALKRLAEKVAPQKVKA